MVIVCASFVTKQRKMNQFLNRLCPAINFVHPHQSIIYRLPSSSIAFYASKSSSKKGGKNVSANDEGPASFTMDPYLHQMNLKLKYLENHLSEIRVGRANPAFLDKITVELKG